MVPNRRSIPSLIAAEPPSERVLVALILVIALGVRLAAMAWWQERVGAGFGFPDSESYVALAGQIMEGKDYEFGSSDARVFRMPGYPVLLAMWMRFWIFGGAPMLWLRLLSVLGGLATVWAAYAFGRVLFDRGAGLLAAAVVAVHPEFIGPSVFVLSEGVFMPLAALGVATAGKAFSSDSQTKADAWALMAGFINGIATLVRGDWLLFVPLLGLIALVFRRQRRQHLEAFGLMMTVLCCVMTPWWIRNLWTTGAFVPTTLQVGASLYDGLGPQATGGSEMSFVTRFTQELRAERHQAELLVERARTSHVPQSPQLAEAQALVKRSFEVELDRRLRAAAFAEAWKDPWRTLRLAGVKFIRLWNLWPNEAGLRSWWLRLSVAVPLILMFGLAGIATWKFRRRYPAYWICWMPAIYVTLLHLVFASSIRYREPILLPLIVLAAALVSDWDLERRRTWIVKRRQRRTESGKTATIEPQPNTGPASDSPEKA